ncbi:hypothetical protein LV457_02710 [Mycobacterium sp. MYCO198283]|uniref:hypothetical protein n=1 Tax=Mycobacterium sp. MYCO198283 TaxID=2883505 RepID=UPI001E47C54D|nr:hypothetical protein [Mycobacterium sp. MYCO198283]MCG5431201.1 hypothetical protein [Mycobacterium sp. MYCO198283]
MSNPARRRARAARYGSRQPTRMTEYQRNRQAEQPRGEVKLHAHLHNLNLDTAIDLDEAGAFDGLPCQLCRAAIEYSEDLGDWQHHATKRAGCTGGRGVATPPDWYTGEPVLGEAFDLVEEETLDLTDDDAHMQRLAEEDRNATPEPAPARPPRVDGNPYETDFAHGIVAGLQHKPIYQATVPADEIRRRRRRNSAARRARRSNRSAA